MAIQIWVFNTLAVVQQEALMRRSCLIHMKNSSTCQRLR